MIIQRPSHREGFEIAIVCALQLEYNAVCLVFDEFWDEDGDRYGRAAGDANSYTTGRVGKYNVVLVLLQQMGKANAASAAASIRSSYTGIRLALVVGVCGGVPRTDDGDEILLGDVVISKTVVQYDFGRQYPDRFEYKNTIEDSLSKPSKDVRNLVALLGTDRVRDQLEKRAADVLKQLQANAMKKRRGAKYRYPGTAEDKLFASNHRHKHYASPTCICRNCNEESDPVCDRALNATCDELGCDGGYPVPRERLEMKRQLEQSNSDEVQEPAIYIGSIASGDKVMKSGQDRDRISKKDEIIAFEMEGAGVWEEVPCIVVKGVCDYADSHKNKKWQSFAAATASAVSKAILERYVQTDKSPDSRDAFDITADEAQSEMLLHLAVEQGEKDLVQKLLRSGVDVNTRNGKGDSPLLVASKKGYAAIVRLLLNCKGVVLDSRNTIRATPLIEAAIEGHAAVVRLLLDAGADVNAQNIYGNSPLSIAAEYGRDEVVMEILKHQDLNVSPVQQSGRTPLHWAAEKGHLAIMKLLLSHGAEVNIRDIYEDTPLSLARNKAIARILQSHGAV